MLTRMLYITLIYILEKKPYSLGTIKNAKGKGLFKKFLFFCKK